jgi:hypothetical protein
VPPARFLLLFLALFSVPASYLDGSRLQAASSKVSAEGTKTVVEFYTNEKGQKVRVTRVLKVRQIPTVSDIPNPALTRPSPSALNSWSRSLFA